MKCYDFDWQINEFMVYCRSTQLRERTMYSYEQTLRLFERWCADELKIYSVDKVTENMIRKYINDLQERGKYTFFVNDLSKKKNYPERRRDFRKPITVTQSGGGTTENPSARQPSTTISAIFGGSFTGLSKTIHYIFFVLCRYSIGLTACVLRKTWEK